MLLKQINKRKTFILSVSTLTLLIVSVISISCKKKKTNEGLYKECKATDLSFYQGKDSVYDARAAARMVNSN